MGRIYSVADDVIVWLGWPDDLDARVTAKLRREITCIQVSGHDADTGLIFNHVRSLHDAHASSQSVTELEERQFVWDFCSKSYWTRRWIIQEIVLVRSVVFYFADQELPWHALGMMFEHYFTAGNEDPSFIQGQGLRRAILESTARLEGGFPS
jgi:Heterokaryon incompatibility protein (HET)